MNRRGFLGVLAAAVAGTAFDPERALWVPGRKLISIPKPRRMRICELRVGDVITFGTIPQRFVIASAHHDGNSGSVSLYPSVPSNWMEEIKRVPGLHGMPMPPANTGIGWAG